MELTQKQIGFTLDIVNEIPQGQAYMAHYKVKSMAVADVCASQLLRNPKIQTYLQELRQKMEDKSIAGPIERKQVLTEILRGRFVDFMTKLTTEKLKSAALQEIRIIEYGKEVPVKTTTIKLHSPIQAIDLLNKMDKLYTDGATVNVDNRTLNIIVRTEEAKTLTERLIAGDRREDRGDEDNGHKNL